VSIPGRAGREPRGRDRLHVAVVGGGIGGLVTALALARRNVSVEVLEQVPAIKRVGASIDLGPNAVRLLEALGLLESLRAVAVRPDAIELVRWDDGSVLLHTPHGQAAEDALGGPLLDFYRPDLQETLVDALPAGALVLGARVCGIEDHGDRARVVLEDGRRIEADVVVAADGVRSTLRQLLVGADEPVFSGTVVYRGVLARPEAEDIHPERVNRYWLGPRRHAVSYWISGGDLLAVNAAAQEAEWARESWTDEASPTEVLPYFEGWHPPLLEHLRRCSRFLRGAVFVRSSLDRWTFGNVTLLGDAAHAMEPFQAQGAAQAIEDAYVLAECLDGVNRDGARSALERYEQIRRARAEDLQSSSRNAAGRFYLDDGAEQQARDAGYRTLHEQYPWGHRQTIWEHDVRDAFTPVNGHRP
jgi:salicylate hydroxylase